jgi:fatty acid desaturase
MQTGTTMTMEKSGARVARAGSDYATLLAEVRSAGLLERSGLAAMPRILGLGGMVTAGAAAFVWLGDSWWQLLLAVYFAAVFAQLGFLGHDAGHQQVFRNKRANDRFGTVLSNLGIGLSYGWWVDKHNRHHGHPNDLERDPDVQRNVLAWSEEQANRQRGALRVVANRQAAFFFPLLLFEAWNLHVGSLRVLIKRPRGRAVEIALLFMHVVGCLTILLVVLSPAKALVFVVVQQALLGLYLGLSFAPNHKGMPPLDEDAAADFLRRQVLTSRNLTGGRAVAIAFGGLNYQIEHHLFPSMPSRNLRRSVPIVKEFCARHGVAYCETGVVDSYVRALRYLRSVRPTTPGLVSGVDGG